MSVETGIVDKTQVEAWFEENNGAEFYKQLTKEINLGQKQFYRE